MSEDHSITAMLVDLKSGDEVAARLVWERFFHRVCALARTKMAASRERSTDEEDMALSAINALCIGAREGRFRKLEDRDDLWQVLAMITVRKAANVYRNREARKESGESILGFDKDGERRGIDAVIHGKADDLLMESLGQSCEHLLGILDPKLQEIARLKLEGYSNQEIADRWNRSVKSVERYLAMIRQKWNAVIGPDSGSPVGSIA